MACCSSSPHKLYDQGRGVTDIFWLAIFILFCFGLVFIASFAFVFGNPLRLVFGYDSFGNICGFKNEPLGGLSNTGLDLTDKKYLFFFNIRDLRDSLKICVKQCPTDRLDSRLDLKRFAGETGSTLCRYDIGVENYADPDPLTGRTEIVAAGEPNYGPCPKLPVYATSPLLNRCVPKSAKELTSDIIYNIHGYLNSLDFFQQMLSDIYASWKEMIVLAVVACTFSVLMVFLLYLLVNIIYWIITIGVGLSISVLTCVLWWTYFSIKRQLDTTPSEELLEEMAHNEHAFLIYSIVATVISVILLLLMLFLRKEIPKVEKLFEEAGNCLWDLPFLFLQPIWTYFLLLVYFLFWILLMLALGTANLPSNHDIVLQLSSNLSNVAYHDVASSVTPPVDVIDTIKEITVVSYVDPSWVRYMWWYCLIALVWISEFILASQQMVLAGSVARWYFAEDKEELRCPIAKSAGNMLVYHLGSIAKGSLLITIFKVPRIILSYLQNRLNRFSDGACKTCCLRSCTCCLWSLEKCIRYVNHNAYTVIAIDGCDFCEAAREAFTCVSSNATTVVAVNSVGDFVLFLAKCLVTSATAIVGLLVMKFNPNLHFYALPIVIVCVFAFFVAHCVLSLFEMVLDTLVLCYCESEENADDSLRACFNRFRQSGQVNDGIELQNLNRRLGR